MKPDQTDHRRARHARGRLVDVVRPVAREHGAAGGHEPDYVPDDAVDVSHVDEQADVFAYVYQAKSLHHDDGWWLDDGDGDEYSLQ